MKITKAKSNLIFISVATLIFLLFSHQTAYADVSNFTYEASENGITITGYYGTETDLTIPGEIYGQVVVGINMYAFYANQTITNLVIPESVVYIGDNALSYCPNLKSVKFLGNAPTIGAQVFSSSSSEFKIYYDVNKIGFSNPWNGFITESFITEPEITPIPDFVLVTGITLDKSSVTLLQGESISLLPTLSPSNATNQKIIWTSSNPEVITVTEAGIISAIMAGNAIISVTTEDGGFTASCNVIVSDLTVPSGEFAVAQNYDAVKVNWSTVSEATGYEVYRSGSINGEYVKIATVQLNEFSDIGLKTGSIYYYKVRAYQSTNEKVNYSEFTPSITAKTLDKSIGSSLFLYMSSLENRNSVLARAIELHNGIISNNCAYTVSEAFRRLGMNIPNATSRTNQVDSHLAARGWKRELDLNLLQPGDIGFTTDKYGNLVGGHATHVFIFMGWANKEKTLMTICDNQANIYGTVLHTRTIFSTRLTDATAFFYHTDLKDVSEIFKISGTITVNPISYNKVKVSWSAAPNAYGYKVYRSTSKNGTYTDIATTRTLNFTDTNLATGKTYYYKVRAYNYVDSTKVYGNYSNILSAKPVLATPSAYIYYNKNSKIQLSWKAISGASGYEIYRATSKNGTYVYRTSNKNNIYTNTGIIKGKIYYYKVRAYRYVGNTKVYSDYSYINLKVK